MVLTIHNSTVRPKDGRWVRPFWLVFGSLWIESFTFVQKYVYIVSIFFTICFILEKIKIKVRFFKNASKSKYNFMFFLNFELFQKVTFPKKILH